MGDGILATLEFMKERVRALEDGKASKESVESLKDTLVDMKKSFDHLSESFGSLMRGILVACIVWALGSAGFIIGVLTLAGHGT